MIYLLWRIVGPISQSHNLQDFTQWRQKQQFMNLPEDSVPHSVAFRVKQRAYLSTFPLQLFIDIQPVMNIKIMVLELYLTMWQLKTKARYQS